MLFQVVSGAVEARGDEIALAKLRGLRPARTVVFALGEPLALLALAAPLGFLVRVRGDAAAGRAALVGGTPVAVTATTGWALLAAFAGGAVAAALAAVRTVTRPVLEQWRNTSPARRHTAGSSSSTSRSPRVAVATVVALRTGDAPSPTPVFLLGPGADRVRGRAGRRPAAAPPRPPRPAPAPGRRAASPCSSPCARPCGAPAACGWPSLLAVAVGLATFAICGEAVAAANRTARAQTELGTSRQVDRRSSTPTTTRRRVVERADPHADWATAAASWSPDGGPAGSSDHQRAGARHLDPHPAGRRRRTGCADSCRPADSRGTSWRRGPCPGHVPRHRLGVDVSTTRADRRPPHARAARAHAARPARDASDGARSRRTGRATPRPSTARRAARSPASSSTAPSTRGPTVSGRRSCAR